MIDTQAPETLVLDLTHDISAALIATQEAAHGVYTAEVTFDATVVPRCAEIGAIAEKFWEFPSQKLGAWAQEIPCHAPQRQQQAST